VTVPSGSKTSRVRATVTPLVSAFVACLLLVSLSSSTSAASETANARTKTVSFKGFTFQIPLSWAVLPGSEYQGCTVKGPAVVVGEEPDSITCNGGVVQSATVVRILAIPETGFIEFVAGPYKHFSHRGITGTVVTGFESNPGGPNIQSPLTPTSPWAMDARFTHSTVQFGASGFGGTKSLSSRQALAILLSVTPSARRRSTPH
jgi:hypothetical protein